MKNVWILALILAAFFAAPTLVAAQPDDADQTAGAAIAEFYQQAAAIVMEHNVTWEALTTGSVGNAAVAIFSEISAAFRKLVGVINRSLQSILGIRASGFSITATGPELHFEVVS